MPQKKKHTPWREKAGKTLGFPADVAEGLPEIEFLGNKEAVIEHCGGILEYTDKVIRLTAGKMVIKIAGRGLTLCFMNEETVAVRGFFTFVEFIR